MRSLYKLFIWHKTGSSLKKIENWNLVQKIFDQSYFYSPGDSEFNLTLNDEKVIRFMDNNYPLLSYEPDLIHQIRNWAYSSSRNYRVEIELLNEAKLQAIMAMGWLKKRISFGINLNKARTHNFALALCRYPDY